MNSPDSLLFQAGKTIIFSSCNAHQSSILCITAKYSKATANQGKQTFSSCLSFEVILTWFQLNGTLQGLITWLNYFFTWRNLLTPEKLLKKEEFFIPHMWKDLILILDSMQNSCFIMSFHCESGWDFKPVRGGVMWWWKIILLGIP